MRSRHCFKSSQSPTDLGPDDTLRFVVTSKPNVVVGLVDAALRSKLQVTQCRRDLARRMDVGKVVVVKWP